MDADRRASVRFGALLILLAVLAIVAAIILAPYASAQAPLVTDPVQQARDQFRARANKFANTWNAMAEDLNADPRRADARTADHVADLFDRLREDAGWPGRKPKCKPSKEKP